jgi:hypothetical protein
MQQTTNKQSQYGKGSNRRPENFKAVQNNFDEIPNFGFKPKWMLEKCDCAWREKQVCDICQGVNGKSLDENGKKD